MKKNIFKRYWVLGLILILTSPSCDNFLETVPRDAYQGETFYTTPKAAEMAVTSVYNALVNFFPPTYESVALALELNSGLYDRDFNSCYEVFWIGIADANMAIEKIPQIDFEGDETTKNYLLAQARFLRAYYYHMLSMIFGPVPLITKPLTLDELYSVKRVDDVDVIRNFILDEVSEIEPYLLSRSESVNGKVTQGCADYLLANVYLFQKNWVEAEKWLKKIIDCEEYSLLPNYSDICSYDTKMDVCNAWEYTRESIFEVSMIEGLVGCYDSYTDQQTPANCSGNDYRTNGRTMPTTFYNYVLLIKSETIKKTVTQDSTWLNKSTGKYETTLKGQVASMPNYVEDPRRQSIIVKWGDVVPCAVLPNYYQDVTAAFFSSGKSKFLKRKYWPTSSPAFGRKRGMNYIIWRYADVLLDYAEVQYRLGNIDKEYEYMNMVRGRGWNGYTESQWKRIPDVVFEPSAQWNTKVYPVLAGLGYDKAFIDLIHEYFIEFAMEGGRTLQLMMRWQNRADIAKAFGYSSSKIYPDRIWFQYPTDEIAKNPNLTQNPGY